MNDLSQLPHDTLLKKIKNFFYDKIENDEAQDILGFLYGVSDEKSLFKEFKKEISELRKRYVSELEKLDKKKESAFIKDLTAQIEKLKNVLENDNIGEIINHLRTKFISNLGKYNDYTTKLKEELRNSNSQLEHLIIYEAPPFAGRYILESTDFNDPAISTYWYPIKDVLELPNDKISPSENLILNRIGFLDLSLVPLPLKEIRGSWSTSDNYKLFGKQLPVWLFEWAIADFFEKTEYQVSQNPLVAIGIPNKTSISIFDFYSTNKFEINEIIIELSEPNKKDEKNNYISYPNIFEALKSRTLRLHKSNVTSGSGFPNGLLMKLALQLNLS